MKALHIAASGRRHSGDDIRDAVAEYHGGTVTQRELAERHGVSVGTIQNWLRRARQPTTDFVEVLSSAPRPADVYRIELPGGRALILGEGWHVAHVGELIKVISRS